MKTMTTKQTMIPALNASFTEASHDVPILIRQIIDHLNATSNNKGCGIYQDDRLAAAVFPVRGSTVDIARFDANGNEDESIRTSILSPFAAQELSKALNAADDQTVLTLGNVERSASNAIQHKPAGWGGAY
jgi:hypothetical protein